MDRKESVELQKRIEELSLFIASSRVMMLTIATPFITPQCLSSSCETYKFPKIEFSSQSQSILFVVGLHFYYL